MSTEAERAHSDQETLREDAEDAHGPLQVSLWDSALAEGRKAFLKSALLGLVLTTLCMFAVLPIYWGAYFRQEENLYRLTVALVDLDSPGAAAAGRTPALGPALTASPAAIDSAQQYHLGFNVIDNTPFDISAATGSSPRGLDVHEWAAQAIQDEDYFGVIIANANATTSAVSAFEQLIGGTQQVQYQSQGAMSMYYSEGRNFETSAFIAYYSINTYVMPDAGSALVAQLAPRLSALTADQYGAINRTALASVMSKPFSPATWNIRPISEFAGIPATSVGMLYLLVFTYFISLFWFIARQPIERKLRLSDLVALRLLVPVVQYLFISLWISLVTMAFGVTFERHHGHGGFPLFWLSNFLAQWGSGMPMEIALAFLGPRYTAFFLVFWIILNVSVSFIDIADQSHFYSYGFILPIYQAVQNGKTIAFGTKNRFAQYFGVEVAWVVVGSVALVGVVIFQRKQQERQKAAERRREKEGKAQ
ncbi:hypothetical protein Rhopal_002682-T1 [Rhodotorula paludigena]|uniref:DUF3533 domain-containing protein n=1 Tax=Rhodotorula paludigena TaxID=86838 RepID=A0AAV5GIP7_9BASI|nr:hypothetical protein Rhopal_002682-T1 [Rhodotorula paludigena]